MKIGHSCSQGKEPEIPNTDEPVLADFTKIFDQNFRIIRVEAL